MGCLCNEIDGCLDGKIGKVNENVKFIDSLSVLRYYFWKKGQFSIFIVRVYQ